ncbi:hypothetical protein OG426_01730 [Streptomyces canus]|uniref:hypothetical protein n=1 Tax=Streptomyces canus TaxID=58343 RepID=UPI0022552794|nr:hypothetical protein [Streptomyces canus]MCX4853484.1 hypothetical protein [Streptomyces canus]WSW31318.1 hypothetical protein OG426_01730 [Streptomyces canus]
MRSVITAIDEIPPDNDRKCSMHSASSPTCNGPVVAVVTFDDAGGADNHWNVCDWWLNHNPDALAFRRSE